MVGGEGGGGQNAPNPPSSLGSHDKVIGTTLDNNKPSLEFTLSDSDQGQQVSYQIQIDNTSDFSSPVVDYRSGLLNQGSTYFVVGQGSQGGTYSTGSEGQSLGNNSYYWRVKTIDSTQLESGYTVANNGSVAFIISSQASNITFSLNSPVDNHTTNNQRPNFVWKPINDTASGLSNYNFYISNANSKNIGIPDIPPFQSTPLDTARYLVSYQGFNDGDENNNFVTLTTRSSSTWAPDKNDGRLDEGLRRWSVTLTDSNGNSSVKSYFIKLDLTKPEIAINSLIYSTNSIEINGAITDTKKGSELDKSDYIRSNPKDVTIKIYSKSPALSLITSKTIDFQSTCSYADTNPTTLSCTFTNTFSSQFAPGEYVAELIATDFAGNQSTSQSQLTILEGGVESQQGGVTTNVENLGVESTSISNFEVKDITLTTATVTWITNHEATSRVNYGTSPNFNLTVYNPNKVTSHEIKLGDLPIDSDIYVQAISVGNTTVTAKTLSFRTKASITELTTTQAVTEVQNRLQKNPVTKVAGAVTGTLVQVGTGTALVGGFLNFIFGVSTFSISAIGQILANLAGSALLSLGIVKRRRKKTHGVVFSSLTGKGVPGVYVVFYSDSGNLKSTVTNQDGRYNISLKPDTYSVKISKEGYQLSENPRLYAHSNNYTNLYVPGNKIVVANEPFINLAIAVEPAVIQGLLNKAINKIGVVINLIFHKYLLVFMVFGIFFSSFSALVRPSVINLLSLVLLLVSLILFIISRIMKVRNYGVVLDQNKKPVKGAELILYRWMGKQWETYSQLETDNEGRYLIAPDDGNYFLRIIKNRIPLAEKKITINGSNPIISDKIYTTLSKNS